MIIYKFGGASVKDAGGIRNLSEIVKLAEDKLVIVISALGKTTNALEEVSRLAMSGGEGAQVLIDKIVQYHLSIIDELLPAGNKSSSGIAASADWIKVFAVNHGSKNYDFVYDQIVSLGEIWSTTIVEEYLRAVGLNSCWIDIRKLLITDERYRDANVLWEESEKNFTRAIESNKCKLYVTQGFIGGTATAYSTTLGREGSDYTAGLLANFLNASRVEIWKDVPGVLNADPQWMDEVIKLDSLSYKEAVEMSFSGAKVIHPKTIKPLHNKGIPLYIKSFVNPGPAGTLISSKETVKATVPVYIRKTDQILISLIPLDFSFVMGENLGKVFHLFYKNGIKTNLVQASAVSIAVCVDNDSDRIVSLTDDLKDEFRLIYNNDVEMITIRYYSDDAVRSIKEGRTVLLEQRTRKSVRMVIKK